MAFLSRSSRAIGHFKLGQFSTPCTVLRHGCHNKITSCCIDKPPASAHHYSTASRSKRFIDSLNRRHNGTLPLFSLSAHRFISSESHQKLEGFATDTLANQASGTDTENATNKVLFVETPHSTETASSVDISFAADSAESLVDTATVLTTDIPSIAADVASVVTEPSLSSLGLVNWTPVGLVQACLEYLHINMGMPWWMTVISATVVVRVLMFPIFVKAQQSAGRTANYMPQMQYLQMKFTEARKTGNAYEASKCGQELMDFMKTNNINPLKNAMVPLLQAPVFISYFLALRSMAKLPVESMRTGGLWWITDLTIPDPYYIMPLVASVTLFGVLKLGAESGMRLDDMKMSKYFLRSIPFILLPFSIHFESAVLFYWCTNNFLSLLLVLVLKISPVRQYFNIPKIKPPEQKFVEDKKGFVAGFKESIDNQRIIKSMEDRRRVDQVVFQKAGTGPIPRTYSYDPTKPRPASAAAAAAKSRDTKG